MTYEEFAADILPHQDFTFHSAEECEATLQLYGVNQPTRQLGNGKYRSDLAVYEMDQATFFADRYNKGLSLHLERSQGAVGLLVFRSASGRLLASGESVGNDWLVVMPDGSGTDIVAPDLTGSDAIGIPKDRFIEMSQALCPTNAPPESKTVMKGNTAQLHKLQNAVISLIVQRETDPSEERISNLLAATIAWMGDWSGVSRPEGLNGHRVRSQVAKSAQGFLEDHHSEAVHLENLCHATGIGIRTLQRCFREYFDLTLTEYLKAIRLQGVHRDLTFATPRHDSVTAIAEGRGFTHLGRFSVEYRERFGESPSETLRKPASRMLFFSKDEFFPHEQKVGVAGSDS